MPCAAEHAAGGVFSGGVDNHAPPLVVLSTRGGRADDFFFFFCAPCFYVSFCLVYCLVVYYRAGFGCVRNS